MHVLVQQRQLLDQHAPQIQGPDIAFAVPAAELLDLFHLALVALLSKIRGSTQSSLSKTRVWKSFFSVCSVRSWVKSSLIDSVCGNLATSNCSVPFSGADKDRVGRVRAHGGLA